MENKNIIEQLKSLRCEAPEQGAKMRAYLYRTLPLKEVEAFEGHLDNCEKCSKIIFLEDYLQGEDIELLTRPDRSDQCSHDKAAAASH